MVHLYRILLKIDFSVQTCVSDQVYDPLLAFLLGAVGTSVEAQATSQVGDIYTMVYTTVSLGDHDATVLDPGVHLFREEEIDVEDLLRVFECLLSGLKVNRDVEAQEKVRDGVRVLVRLLAYCP